MRLQARYTLVIVTVVVTVILFLSGILLLQFQSLTSSFTKASSDAMSKELRMQMERRGAVMTVLLADNLVNPLYRYDMESIFNLLQTAKNQKDVLFAKVYDAEGIVVHDGEAIPGVGREIGDPEMLSALRSSDRLFVRVRDDVLSRTSPIRIPGGD